MSQGPEAKPLVDCVFYAVFELKRPRNYMRQTLRLVGTRSKKPTNLGARQFAVKFKVAAPPGMLDAVIPEATIEVRDDQSITRNRLVAEALMADDDTPEIKF